MIPDLLAELDREEDLVRRGELIRVAGEAGGRRTAAQLVSLFGSVSDAEEEVIAMALVRIGTAAVSPLCRVLGEGQTNAEDHAIRALGKIGSAAAAVPLAKALGDWRPDVRTAASAALLKLIERGHAREVWAAMPAAQAQMSLNKGWENDRTPLMRVYRKLEEVLKLTEALPVPSDAPPPEPESLPLPATETSIDVDALPRVAP